MAMDYLTTFTSIITNCSMTVKYIQIRTKTGGRYCVDGILIVISMKNRLHAKGFKMFALLIVDNLIAKM